MPTLNRQTIKRYERDKQQLNARQEYYNLPVWYKLRTWKIHKQPLCEICLEHGYTKPAEDVHHRVPYQYGKTDDEKYQLFTNPSNLLSVCSRCHNALHKKAKQININVLDSLSDKEYNEAHGVMCNDYK